MTYAITDQCIACERCSSNCPTGAIAQNQDGKFSINPSLCNNCVGFYGVAQCMAGCPTADGCTPTLATLLASAKTTSDHYWDNWFSTYTRLVSRLKTKNETKHWQHWFEMYSQKLEGLAVSH